MDNTDYTYMDLAYKEAIKSNCLNLPNPFVGAVIVKNNKILGIGHHEKFGEGHAEVNAINNAKENGNNVNGSTIYVTLSPCTEIGKTPACSKLIIKNKIKKVIVGAMDEKFLNIKDIFSTNKISFKILNHNMSILLEEQFRLSAKREMPYVTIKSAMTIDGFIATRIGDSKWITSTKTREITRQNRMIFNGIMVGSNTIKKDNPNLTYKTKKGPAIIVLDKKLKSIKRNLNIFKNKSKKIIISNKKIIGLENTIFIKPDNWSNEDILKQLYNLGITNLLIEGGAGIISSFIKSNNVDVLDIIHAPMILGDTKGKKAFNIHEIKKIKKSIKLKMIKNIELANGDLRTIYRKEET